MKYFLGVSRKNSRDNRLQQIIIGLDRQIIPTAVPASVCRYTLLAIFSGCRHGYAKHVLWLVRNSAVSILDSSHRIWAAEGSFYNLADFGNQAISV